MQRLAGLFVLGLVKRFLHIGNRVVDALEVFLVIRIEHRFALVRAEHDFVSLVHQLPGVGQILAGFLFVLGERVDERKRHFLPDERLFTLHHGERNGRSLISVRADIAIQAQARHFQQHVIIAVIKRDRAAILGIILLAQTEVIPIDGFKRRAQIRQILLARVEPREVIRQHHIKQLAAEIFLVIALIDDHDFRHVFQLPGIRDIGQNAKQPGPRIRHVVAQLLGQQLGVDIHDVRIAGHRQRVDVAVLRDVILEVAIHPVHRVRKCRVAVQFSHKAAVHQGGKRAVRAGQGVDIHGGIAVHHALQQVIRVERIGDGDHVFRMLVSETVIGLADGVFIAAVCHAQALGGQLVERHVAPDHRVIIGQHIQIAIDHAVAARIAQRHIAELLRFAEAVLGHIHAPDAAGKHIVQLAARLVIADAGGRVVIRRRQRAQLGRFLVFDVIQAEGGGYGVCIVVVDDHQQLALGVGRDALHIAVHIERQRFHSLILKIQRQQLQLVAVGKCVERVAKGARVAQAAGVGIGLVAIAFGDAERVAQVNHFAQRQRAVVGDQQFDKLVARIAVRIGDRRHAVEPAADDIEIAVQVGVIAVVQVQHAGGLAVAGERAFQLTIPIHLGQLAGGVIPRVEPVPAGQQQPVAIDDHALNVVVEVVHALHGDGYVALRQGKGRAQHQSQREKNRKYLFHFGVLSLFTSYSFSQPSADSSLEEGALV